MPMISLARQFIGQVKRRTRSSSASYGEFASHGPLTSLRELSDASIGGLFGKVSAAQRAFGAAHQFELESDVVIYLRNAGWWDWLVIQLTHTSNALEGNAMTMEDVATLLRNGTAVAGTPMADLEDVAAHARGLELVYGLCTPGTPASATMSWKDLLRLHGAAIPSSKFNDPGKFREVARGTMSRNDAGLSSFLRFPPPPIARDETVELMQWIARTEMAYAGGPDKTAHGFHPIAVATIAHYNLVRIHPFGDGNGRVARLLMNAILLRAGYLPSIIPLERRAGYLEALHQADGGRRDLAPLARIVADGVLLSLAGCS